MNSKLIITQQLLLHALTFHVYSQRAIDSVQFALGHFNQLFPDGHYVVKFKICMAKHRVPLEIFGQTG